MGKEKLVIVESPTKIRTIGRILGGDYRIAASMGHVRDLPEHSFGVDINNNFQPQYAESKRSVKTLRELKTIAKKCSEIYLAPDPDREGEAIAWHLKEVLQSACKGDFKRVTFHEITPEAIKNAFSHPGAIDMNLVNSQQARRVLDRLVGYQVSPLLWSHIQRGISAGRVQSVALRLVCEREREIIAFKPVEFWDFKALFLTDNGSFEAKLKHIDKKKFHIENAGQNQRVLDDVKSAAEFKITLVDSKPVRRNPPPPFITSTLQQAGNNILGFSATRTMQIAQQLYEGAGTDGGLITYMRTDSVNVAKSAQDSCRKYIAGAMGPDFVPSKANFYRSKSGAQEAHEAIRPTDVFLTPEKLAGVLDAAQLKLYTLIWKRFVASQAAPARQLQLAVETEGAGKAHGHLYTFRAGTVVTVFPGFMKVYGNDGKNTDKEKTVDPEILKSLKKDAVCALKSLSSEQKFTEPPPRFSEASLIRELEDNGVGRPSTYASIIQTLRNRKYVEKLKGRLHPSELGLRVNDFLVATLPKLFEVDFTSRMEGALDKIEAGSLGWTAMLHDFYKAFAKWIDGAKNLGAPGEDKAGALIKLFEQVSDWEKPQKRGRRTYDDRKFLKSVGDKFAKDGRITARQWQALLALAVKYREQMPDLEQQASDGGFADELAQVRQRNLEREEQKSQHENNGFASCFAAFEPVEWEEPTKNGKRVYDDRKFFESLRSQSESGKALSERQLAALRKLALKYKSSIGDFEKVAAVLEISEEDDRKSEAQAAEAAGLLKTLECVKKWAGPVKKGRRTYDDKEFYDSILKQAQSGKSLSSRQIFALKKLAAKYSAQ